MKKFALMFLSALLLTSCGISMDEMKKGIVDIETKGLPMTIQKMEGVYSIKIDSMVIINNADPYYGYLVTTWYVNERHENSTAEWYKTHELYSYERVQKKLNVEVTGIHKSGKKFEWRTNWSSAYFQAREGDDFRDDIYGGTPVDIEELEEALSDLEEELSNIDAL